MENVGQNTDRQLVEVRTEPRVTWSNGWNRERWIFAANVGSILAMAATGASAIAGVLQEVDVNLPLKVSLLAASACAAAVSSNMRLKRPSEDI